MGLTLATVGLIPSSLWPILFCFGKEPLMSLFPSGLGGASHPIGGFRVDELGLTILLG